MVGFFSAESFKATKVEDTAYKGCLKCNAYKFCNNPKLPPFGLGKKDIYILLSEPTKSDDNIDLKAQYYTRLKETFKEVLDLNIEVDCVISHAVKCYSKDVKVNQIENCRKYVFEDIKKHKPKLIYAVGATAMQVLFGDVWKGGITDSIDKWTGYVIPHRDLRAWVCPIHTPQYVSMMEEQWQPQVKTLWKQNIIKGYEHLDKYVDTTKYEDLVKCLTKEEDVAWVLERWLLDKPKYIAFDYETTGIKPREDGHRIVIVSMCDGAYSYSFPYPKKENTLNLLKRVLTDREIGKIAHNLPYEDLWTVVKQNIQVRPWTIDTCLGSHLLDNRKGVVGLKFQTFVRFGIGDYSSHVENYLKAKPVKCKYNDGADWEKYTSANNINDIDNLPLEENLMYCGLDSLFTYKLAMIQMQELKSDLVPRIGRKKLYGYDLYHKGQLAYRKMADNGLRIDKDILVEKLDKAIEEQKELREKLLQQPFFVEWQKWKGKDFNLDSGDQLGKFLYDIKGYKCKDFTDKGGYKTDEEALEKLELDELKDFIQYKKLDKIVNTYLKPIYFEMNKDGRIHPFFNLNNVSSFRSSCVAKGTQVLVPSTDYNKHTKAIEDIKAGDYVYCFDNSLKPVLRKVKWCGKTGHKKVIRLHYSAKSCGKNGYLDLTPEHKVRLLSGEYVEAQDLLNKEYRIGKTTSVLSIDVDSMSRVYATNNPIKLEHRFCYEQYNKYVLSKKEVIHHKDNNHYNNSKENLQLFVSNAAHSKHHYNETLGTEESRRKNIEVVKRLHAEGKYTYLSGDDSKIALHLTYEECLSLAYKYAGSPTKVPYDYTTFMNYCKKHNIDLDYIRKHYNNRGEEITAEKIYNTLKDFGFTQAKKILGINHYKLKDLMREYNIQYVNKIKNQTGVIRDRQVIWNNHRITRIEELTQTVDVYDMEVEDAHNFIANGICVHNCSNPNFQNLPKNKGFMKDYIRSVVFPHKGQLLAEVDFSALEVYIGCCYHNDMQMLKYLEDSTADMHRDLAVVLWLTKDKDCDKIKVWEELGVKPLRTATKGVISFPIQYGSYYKSMAADGWEQMDKFTLKNGVPLREHIEKNMGIKTYDQWEQHVKSVEDYYWGDLFASYGAWKKKNYKEYQTNGYVDNKMGLRCRGYMKRNQVGNFPIQGSASSVLMYSVIKLQEWLESEQKKSKICCQIHDSIVLSLEPNEVWEVLDMAHYIMTKMTKEQYSWIDVPLRAEADIGEVDGSWCTLKEMSWEEIKQKFGGNND